MSFKLIQPHVYSKTFKAVNIFVIEHAGELTLIDAGYPQDAPAVLAALRELGKPLSAVTNIVVTHCHPDHAGGLAAIKAATGAAVWMHRADADVVRGVTPMVRSTPAPGLHNQILFRLLIKPVPAQVPPTTVEHEIADGDVLPVAGGLQGIHAPGHSAGHLALLRPGPAPLLFAADACSNLPFLALSIVYDDLAEGRRSLQKLSAVKAEQICFGHGRPLSGSGVTRFQRRWQ